MKLFIPILSLILSGFFQIHAQTLASVDTNKYRINLPGHWKPGNKIWQILSDKLPEVCQEIKDKELCGDECNPSYTIELEIIEPLVTNYDFYCTNYTSNGPVRNWVFLTYYNFQSSLLLLNEKRELITRFIIIDTNETWLWRKNESFRLQPEVVYRTVRYTGNSVNASSLARAQSRSSVLVPQFRYHDTLDPMAYIKKNEQLLLPTNPELFSIIDKKIRSW